MNVSLTSAAISFQLPLVPNASPTLPNSVTINQRMMKPDIVKQILSVCKDDHKRLLKCNKQLEILAA